MNIYALNGFKVKCTNLTSDWSDQSEFYSQFIKVGEIYTVDYTEVSNSSTEVYLEEVMQGSEGNPNRRMSFNSCFFEDVEPQPMEFTKQHLDYIRYNR